MTPSFSRRLFPLLIALALGALYFADPTDSAYPIKCVFNLLTGWQCPACGAQRALHTLLHGQFSAAWQLNPYLLCLLPYFGALILTECFLEGRRRQQWRAVLEGKPAIAICFIAAIGWTIARNLTA